MRSGERGFSGKRSRGIVDFLSSLLWHLSSDQERGERFFSEKGSGAGIFCENYSQSKIRCLLKSTSLPSPLPWHPSLGVPPSAASAAAGASPFQARSRSVLPLPAHPQSPDWTSSTFQALHADLRSGGRGLQIFCAPPFSARRLSTPGQGISHR